jgi:hypothetical protein
MSGRNFIVLAIIAVFGVLGVSTAAWSHTHHKGGFVKACSLDGVNPAYHPKIFGNPAVAASEYGFLQSRDGTWHVQGNCFGRPMH